MSFRKRNVGISANVKPADKSSPPTALKSVLPGVRPSTLDGRSVTSTGTAALDGLLAGHGGLALGCSVLIGESGTTDYAGALLKFFAAEGLLQGHHVHVVGLSAQWARELPGLVDERSKGKTVSEQDSMKIAWRYQGLGELGSVATQRESVSIPKPGQGTAATDSRQPLPFNHSFDLTKRLAHPAGAVINFIPLSGASRSATSPSVKRASTSVQVFATIDPQFRVLHPVTERGYHRALGVVNRLLVPAIPLKESPIATSELEAEFDENELFSSDTD
ncbi:hypothetical protein DV736_g3086, partial [Chaetothyriales sp. CBS 134916]